LTARPAAAGLALVLGLLAAPWAAAQTPAVAAGPVVDEIRAEREGRPVISPAVTGLIETAAGQPLSMRQVRETIAHLVNLNLFDDVQVLSEPSGRGGVRLIYRMVPAHPVDRVEFRGMLGLPEGDLRKAVEDRFGEIPRAVQVENVAALLRALYRDRGYPTATVSGEIVPTHDPDRATLVMNVQSGPHPPIVDVQLTQLDADEQGTARRPAGAPHPRSVRQGRRRSRAAALDRSHARSQLLRGARQPRRALSAGRRGAERVGDTGAAGDGGLYRRLAERERARAPGADPRRGLG
jgi:hypothetical protein